MADTNETTPPRAVLDRERETLTFRPSDEAAAITMSWEFSELTARRYVGLFGIPMELFASV